MWAPGSGYEYLKLNKQIHSNKRTGFNAFLLFLCALHFRHFVLLSHVVTLSFLCEMTLPCQLNKSLLFLQPHLFCWIKDIEEVSLFWSSIALLELLEHSYRPKFAIPLHLIQQYEQTQIFLAAQAIIHSNQYNSLQEDTNFFSYL